jgi:DNA-binding response OmpR family regulator
MTLLVVDDDDTMLMLTEIYLKRHGFTIAKAHHARQALEMVDTLTPDLFVLDIMMPDMNGFELCNRLRSRAQTAATPIIVFSSVNDRDIRKTCLAAGASAYLCKSDMSALPSLVRELLGMPAEVARVAGQQQRPSVRC